MIAQTTGAAQAAIAKPRMRVLAAVAASRRGALVPFPVPCAKCNGGGLYVYEVAPSFTAVGDTGEGFMSGDAAETWCTCAAGAAAEVEYFLAAGEPASVAYGWPGF